MVEGVWTAAPDDSSEKPAFFLGAVDMDILSKTNMSQWFPKKEPGSMFQVLII